MLHCVAARGGRGAPAPLRCARGAPAPLLAVRRPLSGCGVGRRVPCPSERGPRCRNSVSRTSTAPGWPRQAPRSAAGGGLPSLQVVRASVRAAGGVRAAQHATTATRGTSAAEVITRRAGPRVAARHPADQRRQAQNQGSAIPSSCLSGRKQPFVVVGASGPGSRASALPAVIPVSKSFPTN